MTRHVVVLLVALGAGGTAVAISPPVGESSDTFEADIRDFDGAAGYTHVYHITQAELTVSLENDFGAPAKVLCKIVLSAVASQEWVEYLSRFPLAQLADEYENPAVDDGLDLRFSIRRGADAPRQIRVHERYQQDLAGLCSRVASLVPQTCVRNPVRMRVQ